MKERHPPTAMAEHLRQSARRTRELADEYDATADRMDGRESPGTPEDGHTWRIAISLRGSSKVVGEAEHHDAPAFAPLHNWVEVRAWSLSEALVRAAGLPLDAWFDEEDD
jgi:hypothetical protein